MTEVVCVFYVTDREGNGYLMLLEDWLRLPFWKRWVLLWRWRCARRRQATFGSSVRDLFAENDDDE